MNQLTLKLLFSSFILINAYTADTFITTVMGPIKIVVDITTSSTNVNNTTVLGGSTTFGDAATSVISFYNSTNVPWPTTTPTIPLCINSSGQVVAGQLTQLGNQGGNEVLCPLNSTSVSVNPNAADIQLITVAYMGGSGDVYPNIDLNSAGQINFASTGLVPFSSAAENIVLTIDNLGNVKTTDASKIYIFGNNTGGKSFIKVDNAPTTVSPLYTNTGITLSTAAFNGAPININAGTTTGDNIFLTFNSPASSSYNLLAVDSTTGALLALGSTSTLTCGSLIAAGSAGETVSMGEVGANTFTLNSSGLTLTTGSSSANIVLNSAGHIQLEGISTDITAGPATRVLLALDSSNHLMTSDKNDLFVFGKNANSADTYITVDNSTNQTGIILNGAVKLPSLANTTLPASGSTSVLTIDSVGNVSIVVSDINKKENIKALEVGDDFYNIKPISYTFKGRENSATEFGFAAQALRGTSVEQAVIYSAQGEPISIDYKSVFVAAIAKFFETRKQLFDKMQLLKNELIDKDKAIIDLQKEVKELKEIVHFLLNNLEIKVS